MRILRMGILPVFLFLAACTIKLLPDHDPALYSGLNSANQAAHTLFSALSGGSAKSAYGKHGPAYDDLIGQFAALKSRADTRPQPSIPKAVASRLLAIPGVAGDCGEDSCLTLVTPRALDEIIQTLSKMRDRHKAAGLGALTLEAFVGDYEISIEQALTIEGALQ